MGEKGLVVEDNGSMLLVLMSRVEACAKCGACKQGHIEDDLYIEAVNACQAKCGDWVEIELSGSYFLKSVLIMYGLPLAFLLFGFILGFYLAPVLGFTSYKELISFITGIVFVGISFWGIKINEDKWKSNKKSAYAVKAFPKK